MSNQKSKFFKVVVKRIAHYTHEEAIRAASMEEAIEKARQAHAAGEFDSYWDVPDAVETAVFPSDTKRKIYHAPAPKVIPPPAGHDSWYDFQSLTEADHHKVSADSTRRGGGYSLADLRKEIANFKKAMAKGDLHATSMICARLEDCNYHDVCGKLADGDMAAATRAAEAIYAE